MPKIVKPAKSAPVAPKHIYTQRQLDTLAQARPNLYKQVVTEGYIIVPEPQRVVEARPVVEFATGLATSNPKVEQKAKKTMTTEATPVANTEAAPKKAAAKKAVKKVVKKTTVVAPKAAKKTTKKAAPAKTTEAKDPGLKIGKVHLACLKVLATSKTRVYEKLSGPGELKYANLAEEAGVAINNLTQVMAKASNSGTEYPNSLQSRGFAECKTYELPNGKQTSWLWYITPAGREFLKKLPKE